ncbi:hypothetical protein FB451DRAFT_1415980 [Mycena latifolia]|nr:hypothetical protein FB451DRAFT_1415980 [Mycena latifolia]
MDAEDLYDQVQGFFTEYTQSITAAAPSDDTELPAYYDTQWDNFSRGVETVNRLLAYLKHYINHLRAKGRKDIMIVRELALNTWKTNVFESLSPRLESADESRKARLETIRNLFASEVLKAESFKDMRVETVHAS